eukprot:COSAG06_NODE_16231_length_1012_cov_1.015334_1_plen_221_part_10
MVAIDPATVDADWHPQSQSTFRSTGVLCESFVQLVDNRRAAGISLVPSFAPGFVDALSDALVHISTDRQEEEISFRPHLMSSHMLARSTPLWGLRDLDETVRKLAGVHSRLDDAVDKAIRQLTSPDERNRKGKKTRLKVSLSGENDDESTGRFHLLQVASAHSVVRAAHLEAVRAVGRNPPTWAGQKIDFTALEQRVLDSVLLDSRQTACARNHWVTQVLC